IGGEGLARGYWGQEELTAERFVASRLDPGGRLYRTGDRVRWRADGQLEFLGRQDQQVKIRGFRVELGEIEAVLGRYGGVREAAVGVREDAPGQRRLVAYVVGEGGEEELRAYLRERLPDYMVPAAFVFLPALPLTPNGKLDRNALPAPDIVSRTNEVERGGPLEEIIAGIWAELLGTPHVGLHANFFELGGHSLVATQVISRLRQVCGTELPLRTLFEHPTVAGLAEHLEAAGRRALPKIPRIEARNPAETALLSFAQLRLWFLEKLFPGNPAYNIPIVLALDGPLDRERLTNALNAVISRHEVLRTSFCETAGEPLQVVHAPAALHLPVDAVSGRDEALSIAEREARQCFDLARGPLLRTRLLRFGDHEHWLLLTMHHIVSDGWSVGVFLRELSDLYEGRELEPVAVQYGDFAAWQRSWLQGDVLEAQIAYWRKALANFNPLELPTDHPRPAVVSHRGAGLRVSIAQGLAEQLKELSRREGVTLYMTLLAGLAVLLKRNAGSEEVIVGTPIAGRTQAELEPFIGLFVNTLVLRIDTGGETRFRKLMARVREVTLEAYAHQDVPFEKLVEELQPERDMSRNPLVQVIFQLQNLPGAGTGIGELEFRPVEMPSKTTRFDLEVHAAEVADGLEVCFQYSTDLWEAGTIERLAAQYVRLLEAAVANPEARICELPLLSAAERKQVLVEWNRTATAYPQRSLQELFEEQVQARPDAVAVVFQGRSLTYAQLNARANQVAHYLRGQGVGPESLVGLCVERSLEMVVGIVGIIKAGGAYVPLDPGYPAERLAFMLADTEAPVLLSEERFAERLGGRAVCLDRDWEEIGRYAESNPEAVAGPENLAYLIYTSGSTGQPKAALVPQRGVIRLVKGAEYAQFGPEEVFLQMAPISFDAATFELWGALLNGGRLVVYPAEAPTLEEMGRVVAAEGVTTLWLTAGLFHLAMEQGVEGLGGLRQLLAGGDVLSPAAVWEARRRLPGCRLINGYGPTENTTFTCCYTFASGEEVGATVPIGRPIANTRVYVLDGQGEPVPVGVAGELYIGGDGLARGYWRRPELTAERFVESRLDGGGRLYRTGDQVRWRADGVLEFVGRLDGQVKIRGFRVEVGEVEAALEEEASVRQAVVVAREHEGGGKGRVAYVVGEEGRAGEVKEHLRRRLPEYMLP